MECVPSYDFAGERHLNELTGQRRDNPFELE